MKILVIFTGGTIQSSINSDYISLDENKKYALIDNFKKTSNLNVQFDVETPYSILSENLSGEELNKLCALVKSKIDLGYNGIIIAHGTDTLQYTATALAYTVNVKNLPILFVSANYPIDNPLSNGNDNFLGAVEFVLNCKRGGVYISYRNGLDGAVEFFNPTKTICHPEGQDGVYSIDNTSCGKYIKATKTTPSSITIDAKPLNGVGAIEDVNFISDPKILVITSIPCDSFIYDLSKYNAVIIKPYHSGTLNTNNKSLIGFCKKAKEKNIPIFIPGVKSGKNYESTKIYNELSITVLPFMTLPATYIKLYIAISLNQNLKEFMLTEIMGEFNQ